MKKCRTDGEPYAPNLGCGCPDTWDCTIDVEDIDDGTDTQYCDHCGLLHNPHDGECNGCKMAKELKYYKMLVPDKTIKSAMSLLMKLEKAEEEIKNLKNEIAASKEENECPPKN